MHTKIHTFCNKNGINNTNICEGYYVRLFVKASSGTCYAYVQLGAIQRPLLPTVCPTWPKVVRIRGQWSAQLFANDAPKYEPRRILIRHQKLQPLPSAKKNLKL